MPNQWTKQKPDFSTCDEWAVDVAVVEGVRMNLGETEQFLAVIKCRERGMPEDQIMARLHMSNQKTASLVRRWYRWRDEMLADWLEAEQKWLSTQEMAMA